MLELKALERDLGASHTIPARSWEMIKEVFRQREKLRMAVQSGIAAVRAANKDGAMGRWAHDAQSLLLQIEASGLPPAGPYTPVPGSQWRDSDPRRKGRIITVKAVSNGRAVCTVSGSRRTVTIKTSRLCPGSRYYQLV